MGINVSVIMPCYNDGAYIMEAIASLCLPEQPDVERSSSMMVLTTDEQRIS